MKKCTIETTDLRTLLDSLTNGEHVKATWKRGEVEVTAEGPVHVDGLQHRSCYLVIRSGIGFVSGLTSIEVTRTEEVTVTRDDEAAGLTSIEVTRTEEVTVTRDDEAALHALLDSLTDGQKITAEWRDAKGSIVITGTVENIDLCQEVHGYYSNLLRWGRVLHRDLHSVTVRRTVVQRWEREKEEHVRPPAGGATSASTHTSGPAIDLRADVAHGQLNHDRATCTRCCVSKLLWGGEKKS